VRGYPPDKASNYEGLFLIERISEDGEEDSFWDTAAGLEKLKAPNCGRCCHEQGSILVIGQCVGGKVNGKPLSEFVPGLKRKGK
jgi:hypothetical protein